MATVYDKKSSFYDKLMIKLKPFSKLKRCLHAFKIPFFKNPQTVFLYPALGPVRHSTCAGALELISVHGRGGGARKRA